MKVLIISRYIDPISKGVNKNVYLQARSLSDDFGIDLEILTWPMNDLWTGPLPSGEKQLPPMKVKREGLTYHLFLGPPYWNVSANGDALADDDWEQAVLYGVDVLTVLEPDIVHLQHRHGLWWLLESAQRLNIPTIYSNHDWGLACLRTVLVMGDNTLCNGVVGATKCAECIRTGRTSIAGRVNEALVATRPGEAFTTLLRRSPLSRVIYRKGVVTQSAIQRSTANLRRATQVISKLSHCFTPSQFGKQFFTQLGCQPDRITVLPWYFDVGDMRSTMKSDEPLTMTYVGRVSPEKGVDLIFSSLERMADIEAVHLRVAGANKSEYCHNLMRRYPDRVGKHRVEWLGWSEVHSLYRTTDVTIIPSVLIDNTPLTLIESLAYRVPVIATRVPPIEELVTEGHTGFLFDYRSIDSLANAIRCAVANLADIRSATHPFPHIRSLKEYMTEVVKGYQGVLEGRNTCKV